MSKGSRPRDVNVSGGDIWCPHEPRKFKENCKECQVDKKVFEAPEVVLEQRK